MTVDNGVTAAGAERSGAAGTCTVCCRGGQALLPPLAAGVGSVRFCFSESLDSQPGIGWDRCVWWHLDHLPKP